MTDPDAYSLGVQSSVPPVPSVPMASARRKRLLVEPWSAGATGWVVIFGAVLIELIGGVVITSMSMAIAVVVLLLPIAIVIGFAVTQWLQVRAAGAASAHWWHLAGAAAALFTWQAWPVTPSALQAIGNARDTCQLIYTTTPACVARATTAISDTHLTWALTGVLIVALALLVRKSRIAAWATIPVALAGCQLAGHFLQVLLMHYHFSGT
jgi:hypothetical protein